MELTKRVTSLRDKLITLVNECFNTVVSLHTFKTMIIEFDQLKKILNWYSLKGEYETINVE